MAKRIAKLWTVCAFGATLGGFSPMFQVAGAQDRAARPVITVRDFDFGTVASQISADRGTRRQLSKMGIKDQQAFVAALGVGAADLLVEKLLALGEFRIVERKEFASILEERAMSQPREPTTLDGPAVSSSAPSLLRARYIVTGSVTRLGFEDKQLGGAAGNLASHVFLYGLGAKKQKTEVRLTARVIDAETGEIIASYTGEGASSKGWGLSIGGLGSWGFGGGRASVTNIRETSIGEATERAASNVAELIARGRPQMVAASCDRLTSSCD